MLCVNNKGTDQPARTHSLISAFVVCCLDSIILTPILSLAQSEIWRLANLCRIAWWPSAGEKLSEYVTRNAWNQNRISRKTYLRSELLNQANNFAGILWSWIISFAHAYSLFRIGLWHKRFISHPISKIFAAHFTTNLWLNISMKTFYLAIYKLKIIQENAFSEASFSTLVDTLPGDRSWSKTLCCTIPSPVNDLEVNVTDFIIKYLVKVSTEYNKTLTWTYTFLCVFQGFSEELIQRLIADLQAQIQNKDYQLQLLNSSSIIIRDKVK